MHTLRHDLDCMWGYGLYCNIAIPDLTYSLLLLTSKISQLMTINMDWPASAPPTVQSGFNTGLITVTTLPPCVSFSTVVEY